MHIGLSLKFATEREDEVLAHPPVDLLRFFCSETVDVSVSPHSELGQMDVEGEF